MPANKLTPIFSSFHLYSGSLALENPTPAGCSIANKFTSLFQEYSLNLNSFAKLSAVTGPTSPNNPNKELHPGPPFNHNIMGALGS